MIFSAGDYATVYKGQYHDNGLSRSVAVKTLTSSSAIDRTVHRHRLLSEAQTLAQFHHPHIVRLEGVVHCQQLLIVTEYLHNGPLDVFLRVSFHSTASSFSSPRLRWCA